MEYFSDQAENSTSQITTTYPERRMEQSTNEYALNNNEPFQELLGLNKFDLKLHRLSEDTINQYEKQKCSNPKIPKLIIRTNLHTGYRIPNRHPPVTNTYTTHPTEPPLIKYLEPQCPKCNQTDSPNAEKLHFLHHHPEILINEQAHHLTNTVTTSTPNLPIRNPPKTNLTIRKLKRSRCGLCETQLKTPQKLHDHITEMHWAILKRFMPIVKKHHECRLQRCTLCNETFYWINNLELHIQTSHRHENSSKHLWQYICPKKTTNQLQCPIFTATPETMCTHIKEQHNASTDIHTLHKFTKPTSLIPFYKCNICHLSFHNQLDLFHHTNTHHNITTKTINTNRQRLLRIAPYQCNECCNAKFLDIQTLIQHQQNQQETPNR